MAEVPNHNQDPHRQELAERLDQELGWLMDAARIVGGDDAQVHDVFPEPPSVRRDAPMPDWTDEQVVQVREIALRLGYGAQETQAPGFIGGVALIDGGLAWKIDAEVTAAQEGAAETWLFSGSPHRTLRRAELEYIKNRHGIELPNYTTEYNYARVAAERTAELVLPDPAVLPFGYRIEAGNEAVERPTGQFAALGMTATGAALQLMRVDREDYLDGDKLKYRYQPDPQRRMELVAAMLTAQGDDTSPVDFVTSSAYAGYEVDAWHAGLRCDRPFGVTKYGRTVIASLQQYGANVPNEVALNQVPGDLRLRYDKSIVLRKELAAQGY